MTESSTTHIVLHAARVLGMGDAGQIAHRAGVPPQEASTALVDAEGHGWVQQVRFADLHGWTLTDAGRTENERLLGIELRQADPDLRIAAVHREFLPLNARLLRACTDWQIRPSTEDAFAPNDHADLEWDQRILTELSDLGEALPGMVDELASVLPRFAHYDTRFTFALSMARSGDHDWVDRTNIDSCHRVWFELHEDLIATLGIDRAEEQRHDDR